MWFDCAEFKPDCESRRQLVEANPDIAGIGVIVGFLTFSSLAFSVAFTVLFLDRYERFRNFYRRHFTNNTEKYVLETNGPYWRSPEFWSNVLSKNLLALSDTQLVTGLAIQTAALIKHCSLSVYHFRITVQLAFLTSVSHLLALVALSKYFIKYRWTNLPQVFFMLGNLAMLGYTSFVAYSYDKAGLDLSSSLACYYRGTRPSLRAVFGGKWAALLCGAIGGHGTIILAMYIHSDRINKKCKPVKTFIFLFRTWLLAPVYAIYRFYMAGTELRQTDALGSAPVEFVDPKGERQWGIGQVLPLLLLALPLFAGWESFWEEKDPDRRNRFRNSRHPSQGNLLENIQPLDRNRLPEKDVSVIERAAESPAASLRPDSITTLPPISMAGRKAGASVASLSPSAIASPPRGCNCRSVSSPVLPVTTASAGSSPRVQQRSSSFSQGI